VNREGINGLGPSHGFILKVKGKLLDRHREYFYQAVCVIVAVVYLSFCIVNITHNA
jgi:hypothetical protein